MEGAPEGGAETRSAKTGKTHCEIGSNRKRKCDGDRMQTMARGDERAKVEVQMVNKRGYQNLSARQIAEKRSHVDSAKEGRKKLQCARMDTVIEIQLNQ